MSKRDFDMNSFSWSSTGMDNFLDEEYGSEREASEDLNKLFDSESQDPSQLKVSSVDDLDGFERIASDTLVRKCERDLWSIEQDDEGEWVVEKLYDEEGNPLEV